MAASKNTRETHFGSKSAPEGTPHHFYRWSEGAGKGTGCCIYCNVKVEWQEKGVRGGRFRRWLNKGKWSPTEPACKRKAEKKAA